jgi:hypothetical protein
MLTKKEIKQYQDYLTGFMTKRGAEIGDRDVLGPATVVLLADILLHGEILSKRVLEKLAAKLKHFQITLDTPGQTVAYLTLLDYLTGKQIFIKQLQPGMVALQSFSDPLTPGIMRLTIPDLLPEKVENSWTRSIQANGNIGIGPDMPNMVVISILAKIMTTGGFGTNWFNAQVKPWFPGFMEGALVIWRDLPLNAQTAGPKAVAGYLLHQLSPHVTLSQQSIDDVLAFQKQRGANSERPLERVEIATEELLLASIEL